MTLLDWFHEEYYSDGDLVLFLCTECGHTSLSLVALHGHVERHRGYTRFGIQIPLTRTSPANVDELMKRTEIVRISETEEISLEEVEGL